MIKGIYSSGSGMQPRMLRLEVIGNNLANINTTGFKRDNIFVQVLKNASTVNETQSNDLEGLDVVQFTDYSEGSFYQSNNPLDLAIQGEGFFVVETPRGLRYTRNGNFSLSIDGTITTSEGYPVLGSSGRITLPDVNKLTQADIGISQTGEITLDKKVIGKIRITSFDKITKMKKDSASMFMTNEQPREIDTSKDSTIIRQGYLEESNVDGIEEMIQMVELSRSFESDQKAIQYQDGTLERAVEMGRF